MVPSPPQAGGNPENPLVMGKTGVDQWFPKENFVVLIGKIKVSHGVEGAARRARPQAGPLPIQ